MSKIAEKIKEATGAAENLTKFKKFSKLKASYIEYDKFSDPNLHEVTFAITVSIGLMQVVESVCL